MADVTLKPNAARQLIKTALVRSGLARENADYLVDGIVDTELSGLAGHGFFWLPHYCNHLKWGKVDGSAKPKVHTISRSAFRIDARHGFAHPAIRKGFDKLIPAARKYGIAGMAVFNSYNAATLGWHTGFLAEAGLVAFGFTNAPPAIAPIGGKVPVIGTNPLSFAVPGKKRSTAFVIDQSSSVVAKSAVRQAASEGKRIPPGWALDKEGRPTEDPQAALDGSMAPTGGYKGFGQGLIVEVMSAALSGALLGTEMASFIHNDGRPVDCGQFFIAIDPQKFSGGLFHKRIAALTKAITSQAGARLPNAKRVASKKRLAKEGLTLPSNLYETIKSYC